jgi:hypothetical protein
MSDQPLDVPCSMPAKELTRYVTRLGPVGRVLHEADDRVRAQLVDDMLAAFAPYVHGPEVRFTGACWMVVARA